MLRRALGLPSLVALAALAGGCSAIINPDDGRLGGRDDAGTADIDSGITLMDSGPRPDVGPPPDDDGGSSLCVSEEPRCSGDALVTCVSGREISQDCQARMAYCDEGECRDWECEPDSRTCSGDLSASIVCNSRGSDTAVIECPVVCDPTDGRCSDSTDRCSTVPAVTLGSTHDIDLCTKFDDNTHTPVEGCGTTSRADAQDTVFRLEVPSEQTVTIELTDIDRARAIDTIVYIRRVCDDGSSQVSCDDDVPCDESSVPGTDFCIGGYDVRQSRIETTLAAGTYYIVVDAFLYRRDTVAFTCGTVQLSID